METVNTINNDVGWNYRLRQSILASLVLLSAGSVYITQLIFQEIALTFNINNLDSRFSFSLSTIVYALSFFMFGPLSDKYYAKNIITIGCVGIFLALVVTGITSSFSVFLIAMGCLGFFAAAVPAATFSYVVKNTHQEKITAALGVMISASVIGIVAGRSMIGVLTDYFSWQESFFIYAALIVGVVIAAQSLPNEAHQENLSKSISLLYINALKLFFKRETVLIFSMGFFLFFGYLGLTSFMTFALKSPPYNLSSEDLGWLNLVGISAVAGSALATKLSQYASQRILCLVCLTGVLISISIIGHSGTIKSVAIGILLLFIMVFSVQPLIMGFLNEIVLPSQRGTVSSLYFLSCLSGGAIGTYLLGDIWSEYGWEGTVIGCQIAAGISLLISFFATKSVSESLKHTQE
jgi:MFS transporter, YNFM family, putative membrane transport protein